MTTTKHTPGPWSFDGRGINDATEYRERIATLQWPVNLRLSGQRRADGRLIAAAPDLLEALESLYHAANSIGEDTCDPVAFAGALEDARAAIEKAKGE